MTLTAKPVETREDRRVGFSSDAIRWLFSFVRPHRLAVVGLVLLSLVASALVLVQPYLTKLMIDDGLLARDFDRLLQVAIVLLLLGFVSTALSGATRYWLPHCPQKYCLRCARECTVTLQTLSPAFYGRDRSGDILSRLDGDVAEIQRFALDGLFASVSGAAGLVGAVGLLFWLQWQLALVVLILLPVEWLYLWWMRLKVEKRVTR